MRAVAREHRIPVFDLGRLACVGVYLDVLEAGTVRVGDPIALEEASKSRPPVLGHTATSRVW
jgi:MOSC domain-containing protein YiiM